MLNENFYEKLIVDCGFHLLPLHDKRPYQKEWQKSQLTFDELQTELKTDYCNNVGLLCGVNGIEVIDVDLKVFPMLQEQQQFWSELIQFFKDNIDEFEKKFTIVKTKNAGYHILYKCSTPSGNQKLAKLQGSKEYVIETRGIGGQVVIYDNFAQNTYYDIQLIDDRDREILISCCKSYNFIDVEPEEIKFDQKKEYTHVENAITPWDDFNQKVRIWDIICDDFTIVKKMTDKTIIRRHGTEQLSSGSILANREILYLFTPNTCYPPEKGLNPFQAYTWKNHHGNFTEATKDIYKQGFGTRNVTKKPIINIHIEEELKEVEFPIDVFPKEIQTYLIQCRDTLNSSVDYMACSLLWSISLMIGNTFKIRVKNGWVEACILWMIVVGKQGIGKTPSINNVIEPLRRINKIEARKYHKDVKKYEAFQELSKEDKKNVIEVKKPIKSQFIVNDITQEALIGFHEQVKNSIGVFRDEIAGWIKDMNKYRAGSDKEFWLDSWNNKEWFQDRKTAKSSMIDQMFIPILGGVQPTIFSEFYTADNEENGFIDRLLISFPDLTVDYYNEDEIDSDMLNYYSDFMINFFNYIRSWTQYNEDGDVNSHICCFSAEAKKEWVKIFNEITDKENSDFENEYMKSMYPKQKSYIPRFALILHLFNIVSNGENLKLEVGINSIIGAKKISDYFVNNAKKVKVGNKVNKQIDNEIYNSKNKSEREICIDLFSKNPKLKKSDLATKFKVSRMTITRWLEEVKK